MTETSPEPAQERWTYAGLRVSSDGKREHAWLDASGEERFFRRTGASMAVSSHHTVQVTRRDDGTITIHGTPVYAGSAAGEATRRVLQAEHRRAVERPQRLRCPMSHRSVVWFFSPVCHFLRRPAWRPPGSG